MGYPITIGGTVPQAQAPSGIFTPLACSAPVQATGVLTSNNTNVSAGDTVTIGTPNALFVYTFVNALSAAYTAGQVLKGTSADDSLTNLGYAVNNTSANAGVKFYGRAANLYVTASAVSAHAVTFTAVSTNEWTGANANVIATTKSAATLSWGAATLTGGVAGILEVTGPSGGGIPVTPATGVFTEADISVANSGTSAVPTTAAVWSVIYFGTGTANTFGTATGIEAPCVINGSGKPSAPIPVACDTSSTAVIIYSTT